MPVTPNQIIAALTYTSTFKLLQTAAPVNSISVFDATNWLAIGVDTGAGDTIQYLYKVLDPASLPVYQNNGYDTDDYSSPDSSSLLNKLLFLASNGFAVTGMYQLYVKVKVVDDGDTVYAEKLLQFNLCPSAVNQKASVKITFDCSTAVAKATDLTAYRVPGFEFVSKTRALTIYPPETSGQDDVTGTGDIVTINDLLAPATYEADVITDAVYRTANGLITLNIHYSANTENKSACDDVLCKMYCSLSKLESAYTELVNNPTMQRPALELWVKGALYYQLAKEARMCGNENKVGYYVSKFYTETKSDPNCNCCDDVVAPVIPAGPCECTDGTNGREVELQVINGNNGAKIFQWRYDGDVAWTTLTTIAPVAGTPGINGADGVSIIYNNFKNNTNTVLNTNEILDSVVLAANTLSDGDMIHIRGSFKLVKENEQQGAVLIAIGATTLQGDLISNGITFIVIDVFVSRTGVSAGVFEVFEQSSNGSNVVNAYALDTQSLSVNWATANTISAQVSGSIINSIQLRLLRVEYYRKGVPVSPSNGIIQYMRPFTSTSGTTVYPNVIGALGKTMKRVYLDGALLVPTDWTYDNATDTLTFNISITGASTVEGDYI
jgi:hypothetical protein